MIRKHQIAQEKLLRIHSSRLHFISVPEKLTQRISSKAMSSKQLEKLRFIVWIKDEGSEIWWILN